MLEPHTLLSRLARSRQRATRELTRAQRAAQIAGQHETLAARAAPNMHLASARSQDARAERLTVWDERGGPVPRFMAAVAEALDASDPADGLVVLRARAYVANLPLIAIAEKIVHRGLRLG